MLSRICLEVCTAAPDYQKGDRLKKSKNNSPGQIRISSPQAY